jgi:hypothetical protein
MTNTIYNYSHQTGEYISQSKSDESPLELGVILIPAFSTPNAPPKTEMHQVAVYRSTSGSIPAFHGDGEWMVLPDWRGISMFSTSDGGVIEITEISKTPADVGATEMPRPDASHRWSGEKWVFDQTLADEQAAVTLRNTIREYETELDKHLDAVAKLQRYDNRFTFALRAGYPGPFQEEGVKFAAWMDQCNASAYRLLADVQNGDRQMPSVGDFIAALPPSPF